MQEKNLLLLISIGVFVCILGLRWGIEKSTGELKIAQVQSDPAQGLPQSLAQSGPVQSDSALSSPAQPMALSEPAGMAPMLKGASLGEFGAEKVMKSKFGGVDR